MGGRTVVITSETPEAERSGYLQKLEDFKALINRELPSSGYRNHVDKVIQALRYQINEYTIILKFKSATKMKELVACSSFHHEEDTVYEISRIAAYPKRHG